MGVCGAQVFLAALFWMTSQAPQDQSFRGSRVWGRRVTCHLHSSGLVEGEKAGSGGIVWIFILLLFILESCAEKNSTKCCFEK